MSEVAQCAAACAVWAGVLHYRGSNAGVGDMFVGCDPSLIVTRCEINRCDAYRDLNNSLTPSNPTCHVWYQNGGHTVDQEDAHVADSFSEIIISRLCVGTSCLALATPMVADGIMFYHFKTSHFPGHIFKDLTGVPKKTTWTDTLWWALSALRRKLVGLVTWYL